MHRLTLHPTKAAACIESGLCPPHLLPILLAVRDHGIAEAIVLPHAGRWRLPTDRPVILTLGDDMNVAVIDGPTAFHILSIRRFARSCRMAIIVAAAPVPELYAAAAHEAAVHRRNVIIVETRERFEADWLNVIERLGLAIMLSTTPGAGSA